MMLLLCLCSQCAPAAQEEILTVSSPDDKVRVTFYMADGVPYYRVRYSGQDVIMPSRLGFVLRGADPLNQNLEITASERQNLDETWEQPWGEVQWIRNHYNELRVTLEERAAAPRRMEIVFRVYDDGLGFRYELPAQDGLGAFEIVDEQTEFALAGEYQAWWIPAYGDKRYEYLYTRSPASDMPTVHTPLTMETANGLFLSIHEAALTDYASMTLVASGDNVLRCDLVPWSDGTKVRATTPHQTPWRTIQIAENAGDLITSYLILNLNDPSKLDDLSWIKTGKYVGIWWGMHLGTYTWGRGPRHGATTERAESYVDFAASHEIDGVLVEGWNYGWDGKWWLDGTAFDFTTPFPDFDLEQVSRYARENGVDLLGHHETGAAVEHYERQLSDAFALYEGLGVNLVKTGYAGSRVDGAEWHHGQYMVRHYRAVVEEAARHKIMLNVHEPIKDTGIRRTWPNLMTREGARGTEYDARSSDGGDPPEHTTILPFTRLLSGPMDYTPGIFDQLFEEARPGNRVNTTLVKQLALYVVLYSPWQMAADLPENYERQPAFQFVKDVPVDWADTLVLHAQIGDYVTVARQDRNSREWYIGSITDEEGRVLETPLAFLEPGTKYVAEIYADGADAHWESDPLAMEIRELLVDRDTTLQLALAPGGGQAIRLRPATEAEVESAARCWP